MKVKINSVFEIKKTFETEEIQLFSELSGDVNPLHVDQEFVSRTLFKKNIVHGVLLLGMFSRIFGTIFPGNGTAYISQTAKFLRPAFIGEEITARVELIAYDEHKKRGAFVCECFDQKQNLIIKGKAELVFPDKILIE